MILGRYDPPIVLGTYSSEEAQPSGRKRILVIRGRRCVRGVSSVMGIVCSEGEHADRAYRNLELACSRQSGRSFENSAEAVNQLAIILTEIATGYASPDQPPCIAVALCSGNTIVFGTVGDGHILLVRNGRTVNLNAVATVPDRQPGVTADRFTVQPDDCLMLADQDLLQAVGHQVLQTGSTALTPDNAAEQTERVATLARVQTGRDVTTLIARFGSRFLASEREALMARDPLVRRLAYIAGAVLVLGGLGLIGRSILTQSSTITSANAETASRLSVMYAAPTEVELSWVRVPHAGGYNVWFGARQYQTPDSKLTLHYGFQPGTRYSWRVQADFADHQGPVSKPSWTVVPSLQMLSPVTLLKPRGTYSTGPTRTVTFCWRADPRAQLFHVQVQTGTQSVRSPLEATLAASPVSGTQCASERVTQSGWYAWRVGASANGYQASWSQWNRVLVGVRTTRTTHVKPASTPTPQTVRNGGSASRPPARVQPTVRPSPRPVVAATATAQPTQPPYRAPVKRPTARPTAVIVSRPPTAAPVIIRTAAPTPYRAPTSPPRIPTARPVPTAIVVAPTHVPTAVVVPTTAPTPAIIQCNTPPNCR